MQVQVLGVHGLKTTEDDCFFATLCKMSHRFELMFARILVGNRVGEGMLWIWKQSGGQVGKHARARAPILRRRCRR